MSAKVDGQGFFRMPIPDRKYPNEAELRAKYDDFLFKLSNVLEDAALKDIVGFNYLMRSSVKILEHCYNVAAEVHERENNNL